MKDERDRKSQRDRFEEAARVAEADQSPDALDRVFGRLDVKRKPEASGDAKATDGDKSGD